MNAPVPNVIILFEGGSPKWSRRHDRKRRGGRGGRIGPERGSQASQRAVSRDGVAARAAVGRPPVSCDPDRASVALSAPTPACG
jgi:hypothetical protein